MRWLLVSIPVVALLSVTAAPNRDLRKAAAPCRSPSLSQDPDLDKLRAPGESSPRLGMASRILKSPRASPFFSRATSSSSWIETEIASKRRSS